MSSATGTSSLTGIWSRTCTCRPHREGQRTALVGVRGMGGVGKTELAIALAQEFEAQVPGAVLWVDVGERPVAELQATLARALGVTLPPACSRQQTRELLQAAFKVSKVRLVVFDDVREPVLSALNDVLPPPLPSPFYAPRVIP